MIPKRIAAAATAVLIWSAVAAQALTFNFTQEAGGVAMTSSGDIDLSGLVLQPSVSSWWGTGVWEDGSVNLMGGTDVGSGLDQTYGFNTGTDFSAWAAANGPFGTSAFPFNVVSGTKAFATYTNSANGYVPGLSIYSGDLVGTIWTPDQNWFATGETLASLSMRTGTFTVQDALSGESISIVVGPMAAVPLPAGFPLLLGALGGLVALRRRRMRS
jgi:hypothetical protein